VLARLRLRRYASEQLASVRNDRLSESEGTMTSQSLGLLPAAILLASACRTPPERAATAATANAPAEPAPLANERREERDALFRDVARESNIDDARVLAALRRVPRHRFVPESVADAAYEDRPLPIGHDQTISQPAVVAVMTAAVAPQATDRCLEIGTGSGYQAAVLSELCEKVYSIEYLAPLAKFAEQNLRSTGHGPERIALRTDDDFAGWPKTAPFQVIVVTAAPENVPPPLLSQLDVGGRLVIPVGRQGEVQSLLLIRRIAAGDTPSAFERRELMAVRFVPFVGRAQERDTAR
jgi:protein-L-isoaspartate(D-aspartate) O-methyltransferase